MSAEDELTLNDEPGLPRECEVIPLSRYEYLDDRGQLQTLEDRVDMQLGPRGGDVGRVVTMLDREQDNIQLHTFEYKNVLSVMLNHNVENSMHHQVLVRLHIGDRAFLVHTLN